MFIKVMRIVVIVGGITSPRSSATPPLPSSLGPSPAPRVTCAGLPANLTVEVPLRPLVEARSGAAL